MNVIHNIESFIRLDEIIGSRGTIKFSFAGIDVSLKNKDIIGNVLQSWFGEWLISKGVVWKAGIHSQNWPDFILTDGSHLELKTFDATASPNFDLANFDAFTRCLYEGHVERLDTLHLVFSYQLNPINGEVVITDYWIKPMWQLTGPSSTNFLSLQVKQGVPVNIRPKNWRSNKTEIFSSRRDFVLAIDKALEYFHPNRYPDWFQKIEKYYKENFLKEL